MRTCTQCFIFFLYDPAVLPGSAQQSSKAQHSQQQQQQSGSGESSSGSDQSEGGEDEEAAFVSGRADAQACCMLEAHVVGFCAQYRDDTAAHSSAAT